MTIAGWYPDPDNSAEIRWWDGSRWTTDTRPAAPMSPSPGAAPAYARPKLAVPHPQSQQANPVVAATTWKPPARLALTSVILGGIAVLFGWFVPAVGLLCGPVGLAFGIVAVAKSSGAPEGTAPSATSRPLAVAGVAVSGAALLFAVGSAIVWTGINSA